MPAAGQGSISFSQKVEPAGAPGPPFAPTSADNGLSVDPITGRIVLGNDVGAFLAQLLSDREIPLNNFIFELVNGIGGDKQFSVDPVNRLYQFGDISGAGNNFFMSIDDTNQLSQILFGADPYLLLDLANNQYAFGDFNNFVNPVMDMYGGANPSIGRTVQTGGFAISVNEGMGINGGVPSYQNFLEGGANDVTFRYSDELFTFFTGQGAGTVGKVLADLANNDYGIGDGFPGDPGGQNNNGTALYINDAAQTVEIYSNGMRRSVLVNASAYNVALGDIDGNNNLMILQVDDANNRVSISNVGNNSIIRMNGVNGFTGTISPVNSITVNGGIVTAVS